MIDGGQLAQNILALAVMVFFGWLIWNKSNKEKVNVGLDYIKNLVGVKKK